MSDFGVSYATYFHKWDSGFFTFHFNPGKLVSKLYIFISSTNLRTMRKLIAYEYFQGYGINYVPGRGRCTLATVMGPPERSGLVSGYRMMPMLWHWGRADKISNKLAGDVVCPGSIHVCRRYQVLFPAGAFAIFPFLPKLHFPFVFLLSSPLSLPSPFPLPSLQSYAYYRMKRLSGRCHDSMVKLVVLRHYLHSVSW